MQQVLQILPLVGEELANQEVLSMDSVAGVAEDAVIEVDVAELVKLVKANPMSIFPEPNLITLNQAHHHQPNL